jgi:phage terminase small subunit
MRFVDEYLISLNATQAVLRAGYAVKNVLTAKEIGKQLLQIPEVRELVDERMAQLQSEKVASLQEVLEYLTRVIRGEDVEEITVVEGTGSGFSAARNIEKSLAPKDRIKAAELLGKRYGLFTDRLDVAGGAIAVIVEHDYGEKRD